MKTIRCEVLRQALLVAACAVISLLTPRSSLGSPEAVSLGGSVVDSGGKAVAGTELFFRPASWWPGLGKWQPPTAKSDAAGRFQLVVTRLAENGRPAFPGMIWAFKPGYRLAWQKLPDTSPAGGLPPIRLVLGPPAPFQIKVLSPERKPVAGTKVTVPEVLPTGPKERSGQARWESLPLPLQSQMAAVSDRDGVATMTAVPLEGAATVQITSAEFGTQTFYWLQHVPKDRTLVLGPMGRVRGRIVADKPEAIRHISIGIASIGSWSGMSRVGAAGSVTDDQGRFEAPVAAGEQLHVLVAPQQIKPSYLCLAGNEMRSLRAGETVDVELRVVPAVRVHCVVRERGTGNCVPQMIFTYNSDSRQLGVGRSDAAGRYEFYRAAGTLYFSVQCRQPVTVPPWLCSHAATIPAGVKDFELPPIEVCHAHGRVIDDAGKPVAGAIIGNVWYKGPGNGPRGPQNDAMSIWQAKPVHTDAEGRFEAWVETAQKYRLAVRADGTLPSETDWIDFSTTAVIPDVVLRRLQLHAVTGRVLDRQRRPVAGAVVFQSGGGPKRTEAITGTDGGFRLEGILEHKAYVFVKKPGFRFLGRMVERPAGALELVLARANEPPDRPLHTLPLPLTRAERLAMAKRLLGPAVKQALANDKQDARIGPLMILAKVEPERALQLLEEKAVKHPYMQDMIRRAVAIGLFQESPDEARSVVESMLDPFFRSETYLDLCDAVPAAERPRKLELVGQALLQMRGISEPWMRVMSHAEIAKRLLAVGQQERATKLLREGQAAAKSLGTANLDGYGRGSLAERLSLIDIPAALELTKDLSDRSEYCRHRGNIAHMVAGKNPAEAERILGLLRNRNEGPQASGPFDGNSAGDQYVPRVCYRMATADLERAKRLAAGVANPYQKAQAHAVMAQALAKAQPAVARQLLERAFKVLEESIKEGKSPFIAQRHAPSVAAAFLPVAEQIDPQLIEEFLWRAISLRQPGLAENGSTSQDRPQSEQPNVEDVHLALVLARYDRALADALFAHRLEADRRAAFDGMGNAGRTDRGRNVRSPAGRSDCRGASGRRGQEPSSQSVANFLVRDDDKCWNYIQREVLALWVVDEEDFGAID